jgi:hypothetical protein
MESDECNLSPKQTPLTESPELSAQAVKKLAELFNLLITIDQRIHKIKEVIPVEKTTS